MTEERNTKSFGPVSGSDGSSRISRGSDRGAWTMARCTGRPKACMPFRPTMKFRLLFRIFGNGRAGSSEVGLSTGSISRWK